MTLNEWASDWNTPVGNYYLLMNHGLHPDVLLFNYRDITPELLEKHILIYVFNIRGELVKRFGIECDEETGWTTREWYTPV